LTLLTPGLASRTRVRTSLYATRYGTKLEDGTLAYKGLQHRHWTRKAFLPRRGCWSWFCPCTGDWYYWCRAESAFLPVRRLLRSPPVVDRLSLEEQPLGCENVPEVSAQAPRVARAKASQGARTARKD
jgi:hypothetical protein